MSKGNQYLLKRAQDIRSGKWYYEHDIDDILKCQLRDGEDANIMSSVNDPSFFIQYLKFATGKEKNPLINPDIPSIIPLHIRLDTKLFDFNGNHWAGLVIKPRSQGGYMAVYNDPTGDIIPPWFESLCKQYCDEVTDLKMPQQVNGDDCGVYVAENGRRLIKSKGDITMVTFVTGDTTNLRKTHASLILGSSTPDLAADDDDYDDKKNEQSEIHQLLKQPPLEIIIETADALVEAKAFEQAEEEYARALRQLDRKIDHKKQKLNDEERQTYRDFLNVMEKMAICNEVQSLHTNEANKYDTQRIQGELLARAAMLFNASLSIRKRKNLEGCQELMAKIDGIELKLAKSVVGNKDYNSIFGRWNSALEVNYKDQIFKIRQEAEARLAAISTTYDSPLLKAETDELREPIFRARGAEIRALVTDINNSIRAFLLTQLDECLTICGPAPCGYSVVLLGSLAKESATPYSDIEFAILIEEGKGTKENKQYFRNLSQLLNFRIMALGESTVPESRYGVSFNNAYTMGMQFDLGGKTPLNRKRDQDVYINGQLAYLRNSEKYDLIVTPSEMITYFDDKYTKIDQFLQTEILNVVELKSESKEEKTPCSAYEERLERFLNKRNKPLEQYEFGSDDAPNFILLAREIIFEGMQLSVPGQSGISDIDNYNPKTNLLNKSGVALDTKRDIYRISDRLIEGLALFMGVLTECHSGYLQLEKLYTEFEIFSGEAFENLKVMHSLGQEIRLQNDVKCKGQYLLKEEVTKIEMRLLKRFYCTSVPFHTALSNVGRYVSSRIFTWEDAKWIRSMAGLMAMRDVTHHYFKFDYYTQALLHLPFAQYKEAEECLFQFLEVFPNDSRAHWAYILTLKEQGKPDKAKEVAEKFLLQNKDDFFHIYIKNTLANIYGRLGDHDKKILLLEKILEEKMPFLSSREFSSASLLGNLGHAYLSSGNVKKALPIFDKCLEIRRKEKNKGKNLGIALMSIGVAYLQLGNNDKAEIFLERSLKVMGNACGFQSPHTLSVMLNIVKLHSKLENYQKSITLLERCVKISIKIYGLKSQKVLDNLGRIAEEYRNIGNVFKAIDYAHKAYEISQETYGSESSDVAFRLNAIGAYYHSLGNYQKAVQYHQESLTLARKIPNCGQREIANYLSNLASSYGELGHKKKAISLFEEAIGIYKRIGNSRRVVDCTTLLASVYGELGNYKKKILLLEEAIEFDKEISENKSMVSFMSTHNTGTAYRSLGDYAKALDYHTKSYNDFLPVFKHHTNYMSQCKGNIDIDLLLLACESLCQEKYEEAEKYFNQRMLTLREVIPPEIGSVCQ